MSQRKVESGRVKRHLRLRKKIQGTRERPRLCVYRGLKNIQAQLIDDLAGHTLLSISSGDPKIKKIIKYGGNIKAAEILGEELAKEAKKKGISKVIFDRGGYLYHGRVKALADGARKGGLVF